jgi:hypothetical protein
LHRELRSLYCNYSLLVFWDVTAFKQWIEGFSVHFYTIEAAGLEMYILREHAEKCCFREALLGMFVASVQKEAERGLRANSTGAERVTAIEARHVPA